MKWFARHCVTAAVLFCASVQAEPAGNPLTAVVPSVQSWTPAQGELEFSTVTLTSDPDLASVLKKISADFQEAGVKSDAGKTKVNFTRQGADSAKKEGYAIEIGDSVTVRASTAEGFYYASRTLLQLSRGSRALAKGTIQDWPTYRQRMLMLDVGRKPFSVPVLKDYIRTMGWYKMNELHLHFSDEAFGGSYAAFRIQSDVFPGLAAKDFSYSKKEIRELQDYAKLHGVTITPEFDMPGHARCFTNYWPDTMLKGYPNYVDVTNPKTIENLKRLLDEMIPLFDAPDIHIGTDEYRVGDRPDLHEAFRQFINTMNAHIRSRGKNCRIWSGFEHMKGTTEIDPTVIIDMWETDDAKGQIAKGHFIINSNHGRTYIVPGCKYYGISRQGIYQGWEPWMVSGDASKNPTKDDAHLVGGKLHVWCDQGPTGYTQQEIAALTMPGLHAFAEKLWGTKGSPDYAAFVKRTDVTEPVPGVTLLNRIPSKPDGVLLDLPGEQTLRDEKSVIELPLAKAERADLEYPWTLAFDLMPAKASTNRGVILSSDLAEICSGSTDGGDTQIVTEFADGTKRRGKIDIKGIGTSRAAGARQGADPFSCYLSHDLSKFSGKVPEVGKWSSVCVVGTEGRHAIYLNGEKIADINNQMLCPLRWIGSKTGNSFVGKLRKIRVVNRALSAKEIAKAAGIEVLENLAANAQATATASDTAYGLVPSNLTDENPATRWSSGGTRADQSVSLDFGKSVSFNRVAIQWETAIPETYKLEVSADGKSWKEVYRGAANPGRTQADFPMIQGRHLRIDLTKPKTQWGYSIHDVEVQLAKPTKR